jgi:hypothetical protein
MAQIPDDIDAVIAVLTETPQDIVLIVVVDHPSGEFNKEFTRDMMSQVSCSFVESMLGRSETFYGGHVLPSSTKIALRFTTSDGFQFKPNA